MRLSIPRQERFSRGELLLRTFFGVFYIGVPHMFLMSFAGLWAAVLGFVSFWVVLFTGKYPESFWEFQVKIIRWYVRYQSSMSHLVDGYPSFGPNGTSERMELSASYPRSLGRGLLLLRTFFGWFYVLAPHGFCLMFRSLVGQFLGLLSWWVVLFTGTYPVSWHEFRVGTLRWMVRLQFYNGFLTDQYPPFSGREPADEAAPAPPASRPPAGEEAPVPPQGTVPQ